MIAPHEIKQVYRILAMQKQPYGLQQIYAKRLMHKYNQHNLILICSFPHKEVVTRITSINNMSVYMHIHIGVHIIYKSANQRHHINDQ